MIEDYETSAERELSAELDDVRAERDRLRAVVDSYVDELSHIAFAVAPHAGAVHHDDILTLVQVVVGERDHLRTAAVGFKAERDRLRTVVADVLPFLRGVTDCLRDSDGGPLDAWSLADETAAAYRALAGAVDDRVQLDVGPTGENT